MPQSSVPAPSHASDTTLADARDCLMRARIVINAAIRNRDTGMLHRALVVEHMWERLIARKIGQLALPRD